jgi:hypothetical protein
MRLRHNEGPIEVETDVEAIVVAVGLVGVGPRSRRPPKFRKSDKDVSDKKI